MGDVIPIHSRRRFKIEEAESLLPIVRRITERADQELMALRDHLKFVPSDEPLARRLQMEADLVVRRWAVKISQLGCEPRGVWLVDFDAGAGWFSWRLGDESLSYFHPHDGPREDLSDALPPELPS